jgi:hypothetical protein
MAGAFDWRNYLALARELHDAARGDEAKLRTATSRAYYAARHAAVDWLPTHALASIAVARPDGTRSLPHTRIWRRLRESTDPRVRRVGRLGDRLREAREAADYEAIVPEVGRLAEDALAWAGRIIADLARLSPGP